MASINFRLRSQADKKVSIYIHLTLGRSKKLETVTGFSIHPSDWKNYETKKGSKTITSKYGLPKNSNLVGIKNLKASLTKLSSFVEVKINSAYANGEIIDLQWLKYQIDDCFDRIDHDEEKVNNSLVDFIQRTIDYADTKVLKSGKIGLSANRIKGYVTFKGVIEAFQGHIGKEIQFTDINPVFEDDFRNWLLKTKMYSQNYAGKNFDNLKAVCSEAKRLEIEVHSHAKDIRSFSEDKGDRDVITLSFNEIETIEKLNNLLPHLKNTRKWLLLGCEIGQRGGDLLCITEKNLHKRNGVLFLDIKQQKTGKKIPIVVKPSIKKILDSGLPYKISIQKFNEYLKDLCELAGIDSLTKGKIYDKKTGRKVSKLYPKFKLITSHTCRRSFATNYYKQIPTPLLMVATGHSKESLFLDYIGEKEDKDADAKLLYKYAMIFEKERQNEKKKDSKMRVVKNSIN